MCRETKRMGKLFNNERIHSAIGYRTPRECYEEYEEKHLKLKIDSFKRSK
jgi:transposase InsO family protein